MNDIVFSMLIAWRLVRQLEERVPDFRAKPRGRAAATTPLKKP